MSKTTGMASAGVVASTPLTVNVGGFEVGLVSMILGLLAVGLTRMMLTTRDRKPQSREYNFIVLMLAIVVWFSLFLEYSPGPGVSVAWGSGIGVSIVLLVDVFGERIVAMIRALLGKETT